MKLTSDELGKKAYEKVKSLIISKQLVPGQKIVQEKLAEQLGISRTPLRAGLQMLEAESLVESIPRRGVVVKEFSDMEILEIYDCRIALESMAVSLFAQKASQKEIDNLSKLFKPFLDSVEINQDKYQKADSLFHDTLIKCCGNSFLYNIFQKSNLLFCINLIGLLRPPQETLQEHLDIITAIKNKEVEKAGELIKDHLNATKKLILKNIEDGA